MTNKELRDSDGRETVSAPGPKYCEKFAGVVQLVEHLLAKQKVVGSRPIARLFDSFMARYPSG